MDVDRLGPRPVERHRVEPGTVERRLVGPRAVVPRPLERRVLGAGALVGERLELTRLDVGDHDGPARPAQNRPGGTAPHELLEVTASLPMGRQLELTPGRPR